LPPAHHTSRQQNENQCHSEGDFESESKDSSGDEKKYKSYNDNDEND
jgi:hypothetical protein